MRKVILIIGLLFVVSFCYAQEHIERFANELDSIYAVYTIDEQKVIFAKWVEKGELTEKQIADNTKRIGHLFIAEQVGFIGTRYDAWLRKNNLK